MNETRARWEGNAVGYGTGVLMATVLLVWVDASPWSVLAGEATYCIGIVWYSRRAA